MAKFDIEIEMRKKLLRQVRVYSCKDYPQWFLLKLVEECRR
jgi:hypothetical protein